MERFTSPAEDSLPLLRLYFRSLVTGALAPRWCPVLYVVALSHVNAFIFSQDAAAQVQHIAVSRWKVNGCCCCHFWKSVTNFPEGLRKKRLFTSTSRLCGVFILLATVLASLVKPEGADRNELSEVFCVFMVHTNCNFVPSNELIACK